MLDSLSKLGTFLVESIGKPLVEAMATLLTALFNAATALLEALTSALNTLTEAFTRALSALASVFTDDEEHGLTTNDSAFMV